MPAMKRCPGCNKAGPPTHRLTDLIRPVNKRLEAPLRRQHVDVPLDGGCRTELALPQQLQRQLDVPLLADLRGKTHGSGRNM